MQQPPTELSYKQSFLQSDFDLTKLTEFNPALIYGFETEISLLESKRDGGVEHILHSVGQNQDIYNAYMYAQEVIIPEVKQMGFNNITQDRVITWLDEIHKRIAATLANDAADANIKGIKAGACSERFILRWHKEADLSTLLNRYLSGLAAPNTNMAAILLDRGIEATTAYEFMEILHKVVKDDSIKIPESELQDMNMSSVYFQGNIGIAKLATAYHNKLFSEKERKCIDKVVKICPQPSEFPGIRKQFVVDFLAQLQSTNPSNKESVAKLAFNIFFGITEGHWWFNANGRAATCFLNTILRILGKPSILVRNPSEKGSPTSSYTKAISMIDKEPQLLQKHLADRIEETENGNFYTNQSSAEQLLLRVKLAKQILRIKLEFPEYKLNTFFRLQHQRISSESYSVQRTPEEAVSFILQGLIKSIAVLRAQLTKLKNNSIISHLAETVPENKLPSEDASQAQFRR